MDENKIGWICDGVIVEYLLIFKLCDSVVDKENINLWV